MFYNYTAQESVAAPLAWASIFGLTGRSVLGKQFVNPYTSKDLAFQLKLYVDGPLIFTLGRNSAGFGENTMVESWNGFYLAYPCFLRKAQYGFDFALIGRGIKNTPTSICSEVEGSPSDELKPIQECMLKKNIVPVKKI